MKKNALKLPQEVLVSKHFFNFAIMKLLCQNIVIAIVAAVVWALPQDVSGRRVDGAVFATLDSITTDSLYFSVHNKLNDSISLFTSYLPTKNPREYAGYCKSVYLHRYNSVNDSYTLSFAPLLPFLTLGYSDRIYVGADAVIANRVHFSLETVAPGANRAIVLPVTAILQREYVRDFNTHSLRVWDFLYENDPEKVIKTERIEAEKLDCVYVEFAYYMTDAITEIFNDRLYYTERQDRLLHDYYLVGMPVMTVFN